MFSCEISKLLTIPLWNKVTVLKIMVKMWIGDICLRAPGQQQTVYLEISNKGQSCFFQIPNHPICICWFEQMSITYGGCKETVTVQINVLFHSKFLSSFFIFTLFKLLGIPASLLGFNGVLFMLTFHRTSIQNQNIRMPSCFSHPCWYKVC